VVLAALGENHAAGAVGHAALRGDVVLVLRRRFDGDNEETGASCRVVPPQSRRYHGTHIHTHIHTHLCTEIQRHAHEQVRTEPMGDVLVRCCDHDADALALLEDPAPERGAESRGGGAVQHGCELVDEEGGDRGTGLARDLAHREGEVQAGALAIGEKTGREREETGFGEAGAGEERGGVLERGGEEVDDAEVVVRDGGGGVD
jgi:hypothetical protein